MNKKFTEAYKSVMLLKTEKGVALQDILEELHSYVHKIDFPRNVRIYLLDRMAEIEDRLAIGANEHMQTGALVASFQQAKNMVASYV